MRPNRSRAIKLVGMPGFQARPLRNRTLVVSKRMLGFDPVLWPAGRRVFPILLPPIDGQIEQTITVIHRLDATQ